MYQHNVQHVAVRGAASASTARKMVYNTSVASHILNTTVADEQITGRVVMKVANSDCMVGGLVIREDSAYYLVESPKFSGRYYVVVLSADGTYRCSSRDERTIDRCIAAVVEYKSQRMAA